MKLIKVLSAVVVFLLAFTVNAHAQKNYIRDADRAYDSQQYYNASELYKKGMAKIKNKQEKARITYQIAECYRMMNDWKQAESCIPKQSKRNTTTIKCICISPRPKKST